MTLGITAYFAIKRAMMDARRELTGRTTGSRWTPATCQRIQLNCGITTDNLNLSGASAGTAKPSKAPLVFDIPTTTNGAGIGKL